MARDPGAGAPAVTGTGDTGTARTVLRPTVFGIAVAVVVVVTAVVSPAVADPSVTGLVWGGLVGALVLGLAWPVLAVRSLGVQVVRAPTDLVVGQLASIELALSGRASGLSVSCTGSGAVVLDAVAPGVVRVPLTIGARGEFRRIRVDVGSDAPFGVALATRTRLLDLPRSVLVGPVPVSTDARPGPLAGDHHDPVPQGRASGGESVRSVRPYTTGDPAHLVHWPSTARAGALVVRELEPLSNTGLAVVVDLGPIDGPLDDAELDHAAGRAAGAAERVLELGGRVTLCTAEVSGPVRHEVTGVVDLRRRLAVATRGTPALPPEGWPVLVVSPGTTLPGGPP